jgi:hypothetical protein
MKRTTELEAIDWQTFPQITEFGLAKNETVVLIRFQTDSKNGLEYYYFKITSEAAKRLGQGIYFQAQK